MSDTPETDEAYSQASMDQAQTSGDLASKRYALSCRLERERNQAMQERDELAMHALELASYANESLEKNQPEFLNGLFERIEKYAQSHQNIYGNLEKLKEPK